MLNPPLNGVGSQHHAQGPSTPGRSHIIHFKWGWVGPMAGLDGHGGNKPLVLAGVRTPNRPARNGSLSRLLNSVNN